MPLKQPKTSPTHLSSRHCEERPLRPSDLSPGHSTSCHCEERPSRRSNLPAGQVLVIFAVSLVVLLLFVGLALDAGSMYVTYGQLKRALDAAAVAAANNFKRMETGITMIQRREYMRQTALEVLRLHNVDVSRVTLDIFVCDLNEDGVTDADLQTTLPEFYRRCPAPGEPPRKMVWVQARLATPFYFLSLLGFSSFDLQSSAIAEAAPVDVVILLDVSESMGVSTPGYVVNDFDPNSGATLCNPDPAKPTDQGTCRPLLEAKQAASALLDSLYDGYDRIALVTFDQVAYAHPVRTKAGISTFLSDDLSGDVQTQLNHLKLHDDPPYRRIWSNWTYTNGRFNLTNPEDRDGDGRDADNAANLGYACPDMSDGASAADKEKMKDRWWSKDEGAPVTLNPIWQTWGGVPCDRDDQNDSLDWNMNGEYDASDKQASDAWLAQNDPDGAGPVSVTLSPLSTCTGCGLRAASNVLKQYGRPGAVWVIVMLSDGVVNLSDTHQNAGTVNGKDVIPASFPDGFCTGKLGAGYWNTICIDRTTTDRYCIDEKSETCPPDSTWLDVNSWSPNTDQLQYSVYDYALDMADEAALTKSMNPREPRGSDIAIYTIGLNLFTYVGGVPTVSPVNTVGIKLLRYIAAVGDDGDRTTDPCVSTPGITITSKECGQFYATNDPKELTPIFEDIATRIYTRISE